MLNKVWQMIKENLRLHLLLTLLVKERYKMNSSAKKYALKHPKGTISLIPEYSHFEFNELKDKDILLLVVYSPKSLLMYERYLEMLYKLNYKIIIISNGKLNQEFINKFKSNIFFMAERHNIGRDFGTYKEFIQLIHRKNCQPKNLIICNDSIFANLIKADNRFVEFILKNNDKDFVGAAEYLYKPGYHVQSYFVKFSNNVLNHKHFIDFWNNFTISDDRRKNIHNGEIKLSESVLKAGFHPTVFLNTDNIIETITKDKSTLQKFLIEISANKHIDQNIVSGLKELSLACYRKNTTNEHIAYYIASLKQEISRIIDKYGIIVVCPFFIINEFGFPFLKRDLVYRQISEWGLIRTMGKNLDQDLLEEYINDQRTRKRAWNLNLKDRIMYHTGMN